MHYLDFAAVFYSDRKNLASQLRQRHGEVIGFYAAHYCWGQMKYRTCRTWVCQVLIVDVGDIYILKKDRAVWLANRFVRTHLVSSFLFGEPRTARTSLCRPRPIQKPTTVPAAPAWRATLRRLLAGRPPRGTNPGTPPRGRGALVIDQPGADPGAVGLIIDIDLTRTEVAGVMPPAFVIPGSERRCGSRSPSTGRRRNWATSSTGTWRASRAASRLPRSRSRTRAIGPPARPAGRTGRFARNSARQPRRPRGQGPSPPRPLSPRTAPPPTCGNSTGTRERPHLSPSLSAAP